MRGVLRSIQSHGVITTRQREGELRCCCCLLIPWLEVGFVLPSATSRHYDNRIAHASLHVYGKSDLCVLMFYLYANCRVTLALLSQAAVAGVGMVVCYVFELHVGKY